MARWRPLPTQLPPETKRLIQRLRLLKDRTGLSYSALAGRTPYSASSWHRYLGGTTFPPWDAADALGRLAGADARDLVRLRVLWEAADTDRRSGPPTPPQPASAPEPASGASPEPASGASPEPASASAPEFASASQSAPASAPSSASPVPVLPGKPQPGPPVPRPSPHTGPGAPAAAPGPGGPKARRRARVVRAVSGVFAVTLVAAVPASAPDGVARPKWPWPVGVQASQAPGDTVAGCRGQTCRGRDAERTGCAEDRRSLGRYVRDGHRVQLFHSPACAAVWGEVAPSDDVRGLSLSVRGAGQSWEEPGTAQSRMLPAPARLGSNVQFCAVLPGVQACLDAGHQVWSARGVR